ncbi:MarR family winged helix-turn-helix transcriptional regulator [Streptomyces sp. NPDC005262]|uniref:MarR family winged helix-turn-helix transcriptional regulator n=1 Tax=Streptomyces sp. NPDC005262 TaxID=3364710 RepID=UPI0036992007
MLRGGGDCVVWCRLRLPRWCSAASGGTQCASGRTLSYLQFFLLGRLAEAPQGRTRMPDLADTVIHSRSGLSYQATKLESAGLLRREPSPEDERSVTAVITDQGRALLEKVLPGHVAVVEQGMFDALDDQQADALADALGAVRDRLRTLTPSSAERRRSRN